MPRVTTTTAETSFSSSSFIFVIFNLIFVQTNKVSKISHWLTPNVRQSVRHFEGHSDICNTIPNNSSEGTKRLSLAIQTDSCHLFERNYTLARGTKQFRNNVLSICRIFQWSHLPVILYTVVIVWESGVELFGEALQRYLRRVPAYRGISQESLHVLYMYHRRAPTCRGITGEALHAELCQESPYMQK